MPGDDRTDDIPDADRLSTGLDPLQGEQLHDLDDFWRVLERLGHEPSDTVPRTRWETVSWSCPQDECDGGLEPLDTRMRDLPIDSAELDESVDHDDPELFLRVSKARSSSVPLVACYDCKTVFEISFRRLRDPEEWSLPESNIVETPGTLGGAPRIDGTRIGVEHVVTSHNRDTTVEEIAQDVYPHLSEDHVRVAIEWAKEHPERMAERRREREELRLRYDISQSAVDAGVEECIDSFWPVLATAKTTELDPVRPVASLLRS